MKTIKKLLIFILLSLLLNCKSQKTLLKYDSKQLQLFTLNIENKDLIKKIFESKFNYEKKYKEDCNLILIRLSGDGKTIRIETLHSIYINVEDYKAFYRFISATNMYGSLVILEGEDNDYKLYQNIFSTGKNSSFNVLFGGNMNFCLRKYELINTNDFNFVKEECGLEWLR